jgi:hypothetical protein
MKYFDYTVGYAFQNGWPLWVAYRPEDPQGGVRIIILIGEGPVAQSLVTTPIKVLEFIYGQTISKAVNGKVVITTVDEPPGWFERKCHEANCDWFVPMVKRMAAGEDIPLEEIKTAYQLNNNRSITSCAIDEKLKRLCAAAT